jgi:polygalacturonase
MKFFNLSLVLLLAVLAGCSKSSSTNTTSKTIVVSLVDDGTTDNEPTLQQAIINCNNAGGGIVEVTAPATPGAQYMISPIYMLSNVNLQIDSGATLLANPAMGVYHVNNSTTPVNLIHNGNTTLQNVSITGKGTIDGNGAPWWAMYPSAASSRPRLIYISNCTNLTVDGLTLKNSPSFHFMPVQCINVIANNITIATDPNSPNTDGIDPSQCTGVTITNCTISDGDDNIAIKAAALCKNVTVKHCTFLYGHGLSIGSETYGNFDSLVVDSCIFNGTTNGIRVKSYASDGGTITNLRYSNITMQNVENPIFITMDYSNMGTGTSEVPTLSGFTINNLTATGSSNAGTIIGLPSISILQNITLSNLNISTIPNSSHPVYATLQLSYANNVTISNSIINGVTVAPGSGSVTATSVNGNIGF